MDWLWIPAVVLLSIFSIALCWYFFYDYLCCPCRKKRVVAVPLLPTFSAPSAPPPTPNDSPVVRLTLGPKKLRDIMFEQNGIPNLDLHGMTILEARSATQGFIQRQRVMGYSPIQIITGRGLHSEDGISKLKPAIRNILLGEGLNFMETSHGGAFLVHL